jgi:hypothetical protein
MDKKIFQSWRKERLLKLKEQKEAEASETFIAPVPSTKEKADNAAVFPETESPAVDILFSVPIHSTAEEENTAYAIFEVSVNSFRSFDVLKTDLKPRTVLLEEGEDDVAPTMFDVSFMHAPVSYGSTPKTGNTYLHARIDQPFGDSNWRDRIGVWWFERKEVHARFFFLFLPCKEKGFYLVGPAKKLRELFSLSNVGWGPPLHMTRTNESPSATR